MNTKLDKLTKPSTNMNAKAASDFHIYEEFFDNEDIQRLYENQFSYFTKI